MDVPKRRRDRTAARNRETILEAAAKALAVRGLKAASMQAIAKEAGYAPASLYSYFRSKDEIFDALVALLTKEILATFDEPAPRGLTFTQELELLLSRQLELVDRRRDMFQIFFQLGSDADFVPHKKGAAPRARGYELYCQRLAKWIEESAAAGDLGEYRAEHAARALVGITNAFFLHWLAGDSSKRLADQATLVLDMFLYGVKGSKPAPGAKRP